jgi:hypothetical protein
MIKTAISSRTLCEATGVPYRQLDYWVRLGLVAPLGEAHPGSGARRRWDPALVPVLRTLRRVQAALQVDAPGFPGASHLILHRIIEVHDTGRLDLGDGITITWETS